MAKIVSASEVLSRKYKLKKASDLNKGSAGIDGRHGLNGMVGPQGPAGPASRDGRDGSDGNGFEWKGNYKPDNSYEPNDVVHYNGSSYICIKDAKGKPPSGAREYWELMAEAGSHGGGGGGPSLTSAAYNSNGDLILSLADGSTVQADIPTGQGVLYIQDDQPTSTNPFLWVQTNINTAGDFSLWLNNC